MSPRSTVSPFVVVRGALRSVEFAEAVFGATRRTAPIWKADGTLWQIEIAIGETTIMLSEAAGPVERPGFLYVEVADARRTHLRALEHGAREIAPVERRFYGADDGGVEDSAGNWWWIATQVEDLTDDEIAARARQEETNR